MYELERELHRSHKQNTALILYPAGASYFIPSTSVGSLIPVIQVVLGHVYRSSEITEMDAEQQSLVENTLRWVGTYKYHSNK
jgi:hypothetical protein